MTCDSVSKQLPLYLYGELTFDQEEAVAEHLDECLACTRELERQKRLLAAVDSAEVVPPAGLLEQCRLELPGTLRHSVAVPSNRSRLSWVRAVFTGRQAMMAGWLRPAGAVALVAIGFFAARITGGNPDAIDLSMGGMSFSEEPVATQVRMVETTGGGNVQIVVEETRQRVLSGSVEDERISGLLLAAVRNPADPGVRAESLDMLKSRRTCEEVKQALLYALEHDPNDGVRLKALEGLRAYAGDPESRRALSRVLLHDDNPGIRTAAIDLLVRTDDVDVVETLQKLLRQEENNYLRLRSQQALEKMNASIETF